MYAYIICTYMYTYIFYILYILWYILPYYAWRPPPPWESQASHCQIPPGRSAGRRNGRCPTAARPKTEPETRLVSKSCDPLRMAWVGFTHWKWWSAWNLLEKYAEKCGLNWVSWQKKCFFLNPQIKEDLNDSRKKKKWDSTGNGM